MLREGVMGGCYVRVLYVRGVICMVCNVTLYND